MSANIPKLDWLPLQRSLGDHQSNIWIIIPTQYAYQICKVGQGMSGIFWDIWRDMPIFAVSPQKVLLLTA